MSWRWWYRRAKGEREIEEEEGLSRDRGGGSGEGKCSELQASIGGDIRVSRGNEEKDEETTKHRQTMREIR